MDAGAIPFKLPQAFGITIIGHVCLRLHMDSISDEFIHFEQRIKKKYTLILISCCFLHWHGNKPLLSGAVITFITETQQSMPCFHGMHLTSGCAWTPVRGSGLNLHTSEVSM